MSSKAERPGARPPQSVETRARTGLVALVATGAILLVGLFTIPIGGIERRGGEVVEVAADEVVSDDLYVAGDTVTISGVVQGDLIAVARHIRVLGTVEGDAMLAGQAVEIDGTVGDDVRMAGQILRIGGSAVIGDDLVAAGFSLETVAGSSVGGVLSWAGYQAEVAGDVIGDADLSADAVELLGFVGGDVVARVGGGGGPSPMMFMPAAPVSGPSVTSGLSLGDSAEIAGDLEYSARHEARVADRAIIGGDATWTKPEPTAEKEAEATPWWLSMLRRFVELAVLGLLLALLVPAWLRSRSDEARERPLTRLGWGAVGLFGLSIAAVLAFVVGIVLAVIFGNLGASGLAGLCAVGGIVTALGLTVLLVACWGYLGPVVAAAVLGSLVLRQRSTSRAGLVFAVLLGLIAYVLLRAIPLLGWLPALLLTFLGFGAVFRWCLARTQNRFRPGPDPDGSGSEGAVQAA